MPVDIASGAVRLEAEDVLIAGRVDLIWNRSYSADLLERRSALGWGWMTQYDSTLRRTEAGYELFTPEGDSEVFNDPDDVIAQGGVVRNLGSCVELFRAKQRYIVQRWDVDTGKVQRYCFDAAQAGERLRLSSIEDETGAGLDLAWDKHDRLAGIRQRLEQRVLIVVYGPEGRVDKIAFKGPSGAQSILARYEYDARGYLVAAYDGADLADRYEYDAQGLVTRELVKDGGVFVYRYDAKRRCIYSSGLDGYGEKRLRFFDAIGFTEITNSYGSVYRYEALPSGQVIREIDPQGGETRTEYDDYGRIIAKITPTGGATRYTYDEAGNRASITDALGNTRVFAYTRDHRPAAEIDPLGATWRWLYDDGNRLIGTVDPLGHRWTAEYDAQGNLVVIENPRGDRKEQQFERGLLKATTDWVGNVTRFDFDDFGRVVRRTEPAGHSTEVSYDRVGNPVAVTLPDGSVQRAEYDAVGNVISFVDGNGAVYRFVYGPCNRLLQRTDPTNATVRYVWGSEPGRLDAVVNPNGDIFRFFYNDLGDVVREVSFDGAERHITRNAAGYVTTYVNGNGESIGIERNAANRAVALLLPNGEGASFSYDANAALIAAANPFGTVRFERDVLGRIVRDVQDAGWAHSHYDVLGHLKDTATSFGHSVHYEVDPNGQVRKLTTAGGDVLQFEHDANGLEVRRESDGGAVLEQSYDSLGRLIDQRVGPGRLDASGRSVIPQRREVIRRTYAYDRIGALTSQQDSRRGRLDYTYDPAERLLQVLHTQGPAQFFDYDAADNLKQHATQGAAADTLIHGPGNRLLQKGSTHYEYDAEGRRIRKIEHATTAQEKVWHYRWDALDRLRAVTDPDGAVWEYEYDALARRITKTGPGVQVGFLWDRAVIVHELQQARPRSTWIFDERSFAPLATVQNDQLYSIVNDQIGTPREIIDARGTLVWSLDTDAWGRELPPADASHQAVQCPVRFQGQWADSESGLHYNRYRYYDPETGAYISQDPLLLLGGDNFYAYCPNPINWTDPLGLTPAPASLPNEPGIYIVSNGNQSYVGQAGMGSGGEGQFVQGMNARLGASSDPGQALLGQPGTKVQFIRVDLGTATSQSERNNILRYYEAREYDKETAKGQTMLNQNRPQAASKTEKAEGLIKKRGASAASRRTTCR